MNGGSDGNVCSGDSGTHTVRQNQENADGESKDITALQKYVRVQQPCTHDGY